MIAKNKNLILTGAVIALIFTGLSCIEKPPVTESPDNADSNYKKLRHSMVDLQIKARGVKNERVLNTMRTVPRHLFVPEKLRYQAYTDQPLPIGEGQTISQPYIVALMTELLRPHENDRVLEIGTGSGYQAAVLAELCREVYTIEIVEPLASSADRLLKDMGYKNINVKHGDGFKGWKEHAPFDGIIVTAAPPDVPPPLLEQLAEGGRMVIPVGPQWKWQDLYLIKREDGKIIKKKIIPVGFVPMTGPGVKNMEEPNGE